MTESSKQCIIKTGDLVVYKPSDKGWYSDVMSDPSERLVPGKIYRVEKIQNERYVVVEGYTHPSGGIHWTEFELIEAERDIKNSDENK